MIFIASISIAQFILAVVFVKKDRSKADGILCLWMVLNALHLGLFYLFDTELIYEHPQLLGL